jgi:hypothetical protein
VKNGDASLDFPLYLYIFGPDDKHDGKKPIRNYDGLVQKLIELKPLIESGTKILITDAGDDCVFHAENGEILWPPLK